MLRINSYNYGSIYRYGRSNGYRRYSNLYNTGNSGTSFSKTLQRSSQYNNVDNYYNSGLDLTNVKKEATELAVSANKLSNLSKLDDNVSYKAMEDFVGNYNDTVSAISKTYNTSVKSVGNNMTAVTSLMKDSLSKAGIRVGADNKLSVNEEEFRRADMNTVKSLIGAEGTYAKLIYNSAQSIQSVAGSQQFDYSRCLYGSNGSYYQSMLYSSLFSGLGFNGYF